MFGDLISSYFGTLKLGLMSGIILSLIAIIGVQTTRLHWANFQVDAMTAKVDACKLQNEKFRVIIDTQAADINEIQSYYNGRKPMNIHDGELKSDEVRWHK